MTVVLIVSFISNSGHKSTAKPEARPQQSPAVIAPAASNINAYYGERFSIAVQEAFSDGNETTVVTTLTNLTDQRTKALFSSGLSDRSLGNEVYVPRPFLRDQQGHEYLAKSPPIRGQAEALIFDDIGWGGRRTVKVGLPPNATVSGHMVFPRLPSAAGEVTLVVPGIGGWQSEFIIPSITISARNGANEFAQSAPVGDLDLTREAPNLSLGVKSPVIVNRSGVADEVSDLGVPTRVTTVFPGNGRYDKTSRDYIGYFAEFSGAVPERTHFEARLSFNGAEPALMHQCRSTVAKGRRGIFSCRTSGYQLRSGNYEIRLFVDGQEIHRTPFEIVPG